MAEILGIDEVGRGCLAGPLVVGAVILGDHIVGLRDSKKIARPRREVLANEIMLNAKAYALGWVEASEVDTLGLTRSTTLAIKRALEFIDIDYDQIIIDGSVNFLPGNSKVKTIIKADDSVPAVSAASIIAKVARDNYMFEMANVFPGYGFEDHVGYGTKPHLAAIESLGASEIHRLSFKPLSSMALTS